VGSTASLDILEKRKSLVSARNKPLFLGCPAGSPFTTLNELTCLTYNCVCYTGGTYCIGTAQSIVKHSHSGQLEPIKMNGVHPVVGGVGVLASCSPPPPPPTKY